MSTRITHEPEPEENLMNRPRSRRSFVKGSLAVGAAAAAGPGVLAACGDDDDGGGASSEANWDGKTIKVVGLGVDLIDPIAEAAEKATGFKYEFTVRDTPTTTQLSITQPENFDILSGYNQQIPQIMEAGVMQWIPVSKVKEWENSVPLLTTGKLRPECTTGQGQALYRMLPTPDAQAVELTAGEPFEAMLQEEVPEGDFITGVTGNFNVDSMGYNRDAPEFNGEPVTTWATLVDPKLKGKVALINDPQIGSVDAAMALEAAGKVEFENKANMTPEEIDQMMKMLTDMKRSGFFRAFWSTFDESVNLMASGEVVIESMWSPAVALLAEQGKNVGFAAPEEGFRGWGGIMMVFDHVGQGKKLDACLEYMNWWQSGEPGAIMARQGYYNPVPQNVRKHLSKAEWDYWYGGKPAAEELVGPSGEKQLPKGDVREGGSFEERICRYNTWNTQQPEAQLLTQRWNDFISA
jgi:putative spermidine/putrescine transport system substrate-binding protein